MMNADAYFKGLAHKRILVMGLGVSNRPLVRILLERGCTVTGCDRTPREQLEPEILELEKLGCTLRVGEDYLEDLHADVVFRTPGMHPGNPALQALQASGAQITSEMEVFFELCPCPIIAVTGSDGKTTTTTLISQILKAQGNTVWVGGNIGAPLLPELPRMRPDHLAVVELSSFQLLDMKRSPHVAVVTNLAPNHLDVHRDMEEYIWAKKNIFAFQGPGDKLILNRDNPITSSFTGPGETIWFSRQQELARGICLRGDWICRHGSPVLDIRTIAIPGTHNVENYMAAIAAVEGLASDETIRQVAATFPGVEHRLELVRIRNGVKYYNDSIASSPTRTIAGLRCFREKVLLIAGGYDKHIPYDVLGPEICSHVKTLFVNGATAGRIREAVLKAENYRPGEPEIVECKDFYQAVSAASTQAQPGDVVLMSPASAAFDQFKNFMVRGDVYKKLIKEL